MKQNFKKLGLLITMLTAILFVTGCPSPTSTGGGEKKAKTYTVNILVYDGTTITPLSFKVEEGDTLNSISGFTDPTVNGYTFKGYFTTSGEEFKKDTAIKSDLSLTTKFEKIPVVSTSDDGKTKTTEKETKNTDKTTVSTTETVTQNADDSTTTTVVIIVKNDETDKKISEDKTSTTTQKDGTVTAQSTEKTQYDEEEKVTSKEETETTTTVQTDDEGNTTTVTTTTTSSTDAEGKTETSEETVTTVEAEDGTTTTTTETTTTDKEGNTTEIVAVEDEDGNVTTTTTTTDSEGNTSTDVEQSTVIPEDSTVRSLIDKGIEAVSKGKILVAKDYFDAAYELDSTSDEAKVYSALADLTEIAATPKMKKFFNDHLGVTNYPTSLSSLVSGNWLAEDRYDMEATGSFYGKVYNPVTEPQGSYYYRVNVVRRIKDGIEYDDQSNEVKPEGSIRVSWVERSEKITYEGQDYWVEPYEADEFNKDMAGYTYSLADGIGVGMSARGFGNSFSDYGYYVIPDDNGKYWAWISSDNVSGATAYAQDYDNSGSKQYTYTQTILLPKFKGFAEDSWFTTEVNSSMTLGMFVVANILEANSNGLNAAIDDLYDALFNCDEYTDAINRIDSIKNPVALPASVVQAFELEEMLGEGETFKIGAPELKLIKSALNVFKGVFEYVQSYNLNTDLSFLKTDWLKFMTGDIGEWFGENFASYNADIDPIANNFLGARSDGATKMAQAKATFIGVIDDLIAAYNDIVKEGSIYPAAISGMLSEASIIKDAATKLKAAIQGGGKFGVPRSVEGLTEWPVPTTMNFYPDYLFIIDLGKIFTPGYFGLANMFDLTKNAAGKTVPKILKYGTYEEMTKADLDALMEDEDAEYFSGVCARLNFKFGNTIRNAIQFEEIFKVTAEMDNPHACELNLGAAILIYNFYNGGYEDFVDAFVDAMTRSEEEPAESSNDSPSSGETSSGGN